jgi:hypothetical protein
MNSVLFALKRIPLGRASTRIARPMPEFPPN